MVAYVYTCKYDNFFSLFRVMMCRQLIVRIFSHICNEHRLCPCHQVLFFAHLYKLCKKKKVFVNILATVACTLCNYINSWLALVYRMLFSCEARVSLLAKGRLLVILWSIFLFDNDVCYTKGFVEWCLSPMMLGTCWLNRTAVVVTWSGTVSNRQNCLRSVVLSREIFVKCLVSVLHMLQCNLNELTVIFLFKRIKFFPHITFILYFILRGFVVSAATF